MWVLRIWEQRYGEWTSDLELYYTKKAVLEALEDYTAIYQHSDIKRKYEIYERR